MAVFFKTGFLLALNVFWAVTNIGVGAVLEAVLLELLRGSKDAASCAAKVASDKSGFGTTSVASMTSSSPPPFGVDLFSLLGFLKIPRGSNDIPI